jgi:hypothetical protein
LNILNQALPVYRKKNDKKQKKMNSTPAAFEKFSDLSISICKAMPVFFRSEQKKHF